MGHAYTKRRCFCVTWVTSTVQSPLGAHISLFGGKIRFPHKPPFKPKRAPFFIPRLLLGPRTSPYKEGPS